MLINHTNRNTPTPTQSKPSYRKEAGRSNQSHRFQCATYYSEKKSSSSRSTEPQIECSCWPHIPLIMLSRPMLIKCYHMHVRSLRVAGDQTLFVSADITQMGCAAEKASPYAVLCRDVEASACRVDFGRAPPHHSVYLQCRREEGLECSLAVTKHNLSCTRTRLLSKLHKH